MSYNTKYGMRSDNPDWNINQLFSEVLKSLIDEVNKSAATGDVRLWFNSLRVLYRNIYGHEKIKQEQLNAVEEMFQLAKRKIKTLPEGNTMPLSVIQRHNHDKTKELLDRINITLMSMMYNAGLIFPLNKKDARFSSLEIS